MPDPLTYPPARPFLKWAGGKRQLLAQIDAHLPEALKRGDLRRYVEPFVGSGAVFFYVVRTYPLAEYLLSDVNRELILAYRTIQRRVEPLIERLAELQGEYLPLEHAARKARYYRTRERFNAALGAIDFEAYQPAWIERAAQLIFLNRTCYNGLFRVNSKGEFNVPFGRYKRPKICDAENLRAVSRALQGVSLRFGDYDGVGERVDDETFVYFDPPYRPLTQTASFTTYSTHVFDDREQLRLAKFYRRLHRAGACLMLSNADPHNVDPEDDFFEEAYRGFHLERVTASRNINRDAAGRGPVTELLILNY